MSGSVRVGDGTPLGAWEVERSCMLSVDEENVAVACKELCKRKTERFKEESAEAQERRSVRSTAKESA